VRPRGDPGGLRLMELFDRERGDRRIGTDLGQRAQAGVAVERRVLHALRHDRAARLLESLGDLELDVGQQRLELGERRREVGPTLARIGERLLQMRDALRQIGTVHGEAREQLGESILRADDPMRQRAHEAAHLGTEQLVGDHPLGVVDEIGP
jgi:hypothetical protein